MDFSKLSVFELKLALKQRNCSTQGNKKELLSRLMANQAKTIDLSKTSRVLCSNNKPNSDECTPKMRGLSVVLEILDEATINAYCTSISAFASTSKKIPTTSVIIGLQNANKTTKVDKPQNIRGKHLEIQPQLQQHQEVNDAVGSTAPSVRVLIPRAAKTSSKAAQADKNADKETNGKRRRLDIPVQKINDSSVDVPKKNPRSHKVVAIIPVMQPSLWKYEMIWAKVLYYIVYFL